MLGMTIAERMKLRIDSGFCPSKNLAEAARLGLSVTCDTFIN